MKLKQLNRVNLSSILKKLQLDSKYVEGKETPLVDKFLDLTFDDLLYRMSSDSEIAGNKISRLVLSSYLGLPSFISDKLFDIFNEEADNTNMLGRKKFISGMRTLFFGSPDELVHISFLFYADKSSFICLRNAKLVLNLLNSDEMLIPDIGELIKDFFDRNKLTCLSLEEYVDLIEKKDSTMLLLFILFLINKIPFNEEEIIFFKKSIIESGGYYAESPMRIDSTDKLISIPEDSPMITYLRQTFPSLVNVPRRKSGESDLINILNKNEKSSKNNFISPISNKKDMETIMTSISNFYLDPNNSEINENQNLFENLLCQSNYSNSISTFDSIVNTSTRDNSLQFNQKYEEIIIHKLSDSRKFIKYKLVLVKNKMFSFKLSKNKFKLERIHNLTGLFVTDCEANNSDNKLNYTIAFINKFGNTLTHLNNIFFCESREELEENLQKLRKFMKFEKFGDKFSFSNILGEGHYGKVYLAVNKNTGEKVAVKVIEKSYLKTAKEEEMVHNEIQVMKFLQAENENSHILQLIDALEDKKRIFIITEFMEGGSLYDLINRNNLPLSTKTIYFYAKQIFSGLKYLSDNGIIHRDLKLENILVKNTNDPSKLIMKISDFGFSKILGFDGKVNNSYGTLLYTAPEVLLGNYYDLKIDIWSFGVILYFLSSRTFPFDGVGLNLKEIAGNIVNKDIDLKIPQFLYASEKLMNLIKKCLTKNPLDRICIQEIQDLFGV